MSALLVNDPFEPGETLSRFVRDVGGAGAVASFVGLARDRSRDGAAVLRLFLDHHPRLTQTSLDEIASAAAARFGLGAALVIHRCGDIGPSEPIVFVAAAAAHRRAAFEAVDYMMDRLKTDAVFWKREDAVDGSRWIEPTQSDRADRARWSDE
ncbi:MAG TPA: molybdenum cofactor biosynthesis protein MoaE [Allosphingosinicella sp.]